MVTIRRMAAVIIAAGCIIGMWNGYLFAAEVKEYSFVHFSDVHIPSYGFAIGQSLDEANLLKMHNQQRIQQLVKECLAMKPKPAFVINSGDTGDAGWTPLLKLYQKLMQPLVSAGIPVYTVVGNHDLDYAGIANEDLAEIFDPLGPAFIGRHGTRYSFDYGGCHFVFLNNRPIHGLIRLTPSDFEWLRKDLNSVKKTTRILLFLHAVMTGDDTYCLVEMLQNFTYPVIFRGHKHSETIEKWGGVQVFVTGALYGGIPEAGSYRVVTVQPEKITLRTRDFAQPAGTLGPEDVVEFPRPVPQLRIIEPGSEAFVSENVTFAAETNPVTSGTMEYLIPGFNEWTPVPGKSGRWETRVPAPALPGRHLLAVQFKGENGSIVWAHTVIKVPGEKVREVWAKDLGSGVMGAPVILQDLVIVPTLERGVYALRVDNGKEVWHRNVEQGQILGRVVTDGAMVFWGAGRTVYACEAKTGKRLWKTSLKGSIVSGMTIGNGKLFIPAGEHKLYCLDARRGTISWEYTVALPIMMEPASDGGRVFFGAMDGYVRALDTATGREIWKNQMSSMEDTYTTAPYWPPVIAGDKVIVSKSPARKDENNLVAFTASDGKVSWSRRLTGWPLRLVLSPGKDKLYTTYSQNSIGGLQCLSVEDGSVVWNQATGVGMSAGIASRDEVLIRNGGNICCVEADAGKARWIYRASTGSQGLDYGPGATAVMDNLAIVGTMDGQVFALKW